MNLTFTWKIQRKSCTCYFFAILTFLFTTVLSAQPVITNVSPVSGLIGSTVTITGQGFSNSPSGNIVYFGSGKAPILNASATTITVTVPATATAGNLSVTTGGLKAWSAPFSVTALTPAPGFSGASFAQPVILGSGSYPRCMATADLDGDGLTDIVTVHNLSKTMVVSRNTTSGGILSFADALTLPLDSNGFFVKLGDIDGDGRIDIINTDYASNEIEVYRNSSSSGLISMEAKKVFSSVGVSPISVDVADFNNDGKADLVVANQNSNTVTLLRNNGQPGSVNFEPGQQLPTGEWPSSVIANDFDGDGKMDIAVANGTGRSMTIFRNSSTSQSQIFSGQTIAVTGRPFFLNSGDLDNDGKPELLLTTEQSAEVSVFKNTSTTGSVLFAFVMNLSSTDPLSALSTAIGDVDGDGKPDIVTSALGTVVTIYPNISQSGALAFGPRLEIPMNQLTRSVAIGDLNGDGQPDLAFASSIGNNITILQNRMRAVPMVMQFTPSATEDGEIFITGANLHTVTAVSLGGTPVKSFQSQSQNGLTAIVGKGSSGTVLVQNPSGNGVKEGFVYTMPVPEIHSFAPLTGPAGTTVVIRGKNFNPQPAGNIVYLGGKIAPVTSVTDSTLTVTVPVAAGYGFLTVTTNKMTAYSMSKFSVTFPSSGAAWKKTTFEPRRVIASGEGNSSNPSQFAPVDFDRDGKIDLLVTNAANGTVSVFRNNSLNHGLISFAPKKDIDLPDDPTMVATGDFDGDGLSDLAISHCNYGLAGTVSILRNTTTTPGDISFEPGIQMATGQGSIGVAVMDLDLDGKPDMVVSSGNSGFYSLFRNTTTADGPVSFAAKVDLPGLYHPDYLTLMDVDGDRKPEIILANFGNNTVVVMKNHSTQLGLSFVPAATLTAPQFANSVRTGDLDGDGKPEIVVCGYDQENIYIHRNTGNGSIGFAGPEIISVSSGVRDVNFGDINGDGRQDLVVSHVSGDISIFRNLAGPGIHFAPAFKENTSFGPTTILTTDLDGDNKPDIITTSEYNYVTILRNRLDEPVFTSFSPKSAMEDSLVYLKGENFTFINTVTLGNMPVKQVSILSDSTISVVTGAGSSGLVTLGGLYGRDSLPGFTFLYPVPEIRSFSPTSGSNDAVITIRGKYFTTLEQVSFGNSNAASFQVVNDTTIFAVVGNGATGKVKVATLYGIDSLAQFVYTPPGELAAYPNPASSSTIMIHPYSDKPAQVKLLDLMGKVLLTQPVPPRTANTTIHFPGVNAGTYKLVWSDGTTTISKTILITR